MKYRLRNGEYEGRTLRQTPVEALNQYLSQGGLRPEEREWIRLHLDARKTRDRKRQLLFDERGNPLRYPAE